MDFIATKKDLIRLLSRCVPVADKKSAMPALANVLLDARQAGTLKVSATDLYIGMAGSMPVEIATAGSVAVPAKDLLDRVKAMPEGPVQIIATEGAQTTLKAVGSPRRYTLHGIPGGDYPTLPVPTPDGPVLEVPAEQLSQLLTRTHFSISSDETRPHVNSLLFEVAGTTMRSVSTDGHRLSKMELKIEAPSPAHGFGSMLIPLKAITELRRLVDDARGEKLTILRGGPNAFFAVAGMQFSVKLVDAQFPPYDQVIQKRAKDLARVPRNAFADALRAVSLAASERTGGVKILLTTGTLRITSESPESGNGFDEIPVDYAGPETTVGFNSKYILDAIGVLAEDEVLIQLTDELDPIVVRSVNTDDSFVGVCMPMRI